MVHWFGNSQCSEPPPVPPVPPVVPVVPPLVPPVVPPVVPPLVPPPGLPPVAPPPPLSPAVPPPLGLQTLLHAAKLRYPLGLVLISMCPMAALDGGIRNGGSMTTVLVPLLFESHTLAFCWQNCVGFWTIIVREFCVHWSWIVPWPSTNALMQ